MVLEAAFYFFILIKKVMDTNIHKPPNKDNPSSNLSYLIDCNIPSNQVFCELFNKHSPFQLFETLLFHSANIPLEDSSKEMLTAHYSIAQLSFFLLQIHCHLHGWKTQSKSSNLVEAIHSLNHNQDELESYRDIELFIKFLNLREERFPSLVYDQLYDLKHAFLKLAALKRQWDITLLSPIL